MLESPGELLKNADVRPIPDLINQNLWDWMQVPEVPKCSFAVRVENCRESSSAHTFFQVPSDC